MSAGDVNLNEVETSGQLMEGLIDAITSTSDQVGQAFVENLPDDDQVDLVVVMDDLVPQIDKSPQMPDLGFEMPFSLAGTVKGLPDDFQELEHSQLKDAIAPQDVEGCARDERSDVLPCLQDIPEAFSRCRLHTGESWLRWHWHSRTCQPAAPAASDDPSPDSEKG